MKQKEPKYPDSKNPQNHTRKNSLIMVFKRILLFVITFAVIYFVTYLLFISKIYNNETYHQNLAYQSDQVANFSLYNKTLWNYVQDVITSRIGGGNS